MKKSMKFISLAECLVLLGLGGSSPLSAQVLKSTDSMSHLHAVPCQTQELICANAATPSFLKDGTLLLTWSAGGAVRVAKSHDLGKTFEPSVLIAEHQKFLDTGGDARPQIVSGDDGHVMIAYGYFKDLHWNAKVSYAVSSDQGEHFSAPHDLIAHGESERFPVLGLQSPGVVAIAWIDKRVVAQKKNAGQAALGGSIAYTQTKNWGETFEKEIIVSPQSCECCRIGMAVSGQGETVLAYRAIFAGSVRDHAVQTIKGALQPGAMARVSRDHWQTDVCPHQGPSLALTDDGQLHVTWFTLGTNRRGLFYARSDHQGKIFSEPMGIGREQFNPSRASIASQGATLWLVWKEFDGEKSRLRGMRSNDQGETWSSGQELMTTRGYSDHPILVLGRGQLHVSWLTRDEGYRLMPLGPLGPLGPSSHPQ
jgi:hypothetical protein